MFRAFGATDRGPIRRTNEDVFFVDEDLGLLMVADGMGGHAAGEIASRLAVDAVAGFLRRSHNDHEYSWPYGIEPTLSLNGNRMRTAVHLANSRVFRAAEAHDDYTGMGTTVVSALVGHDRMVVANVGDSRLYLLRGDELRQVTQDDSWAAMVLGNHAFGADATTQHPMRNVLTNVLGARDQTDVHLIELEVAPGDRVMLCSDGLHGVVTDTRIRSVLAEAASPEDGAAALIQAAVQGGTRDNVTALVAFCDNGHHG